MLLHSPIISQCIEDSLFTAQSVWRGFNQVAHLGAAVFLCCSLQKLFKLSGCVGTRCEQSFSGPATNSAWNRYLGFDWTTPQYLPYLQSISV